MNATRDDVKSLLTRIINIITFVDQPIQGKFLLFFLGVLFWFLAIYIISMTTLVDINSKSTLIVNAMIPHDRVAQKTVRKLQSLHVNAIEIRDAANRKSVLFKTLVSKTRIEDIKSFLAALSFGGQVNDFSRDSGDFIESFSVASVTGDEEGEKYIRDLTPLINALSVKFDTLSSMKQEMLGEEVSDQAPLKAVFGELETLFLQSRSLSETFSASSAKSYEISSEKIKSAVRCTSTAISIALLIAVSLLVLFTIWISRAMSVPVNSMIEQIHALREGRADLSKKITVASKDEIGTLSTAFNGLMGSIHGMATFKKVIEEDDLLDDVYSRLAKVFRETIGIDDFMIFEVEKNANEMKPVYPLVLNSDDMFCHESILIHSDMCRAKKTGCTVSSLAYPGICKQFRIEDGKNHVCIPMLVGGSAGGVVQFVFDERRHNENGQEGINRKIFAAEQYIKESQTVIEAKKLMSTLRESAIKDAMTGLYNRRFLQEHTDSFVSGTIRRKKQIGLIMCDLDYFKGVNDSYGHDVGDSVLCETANAIKDCIRESDFVIRFGGEEFLVLLIDVKNGESKSIAEKIRTTIASKKIKVSDGILTKTISLGISEFPKDSQRFWQAIKFADVALYEAKQSGRNKVVRFTPEMWTEAEF